MIFWAANGAGFVRAYYAINNSGWWAYFDPATRFAGTQIAAVR